MSLTFVVNALRERMIGGFFKIYLVFFKELAALILSSYDVE